MARFTRERTATLSDGSTLVFRRPRQTNVSSAQASWLAENAGKVDALKSKLTPAQREELEKAQQERREARETPAVEVEPTSQDEKDGFEMVHHATLVHENVISWKYGDEDAVEVSSDDPNPYEDVDADVLEEAARVIYDTFVGRKNS